MNGPLPTYAWVAREWSRSSCKQKDIAEQIDVNQSYVCTAIREFIRCCGGVSDLIYNEERRTLVRRLVTTYERCGGEFKLPMKSTIVHPYSIEESAARCEHAWLLRAEGLTFKDIGQRLGGISVERTRQLVLRFSRRMRKATYRTRFRFIDQL